MPQAQYTPFPVKAFLTRLYRRAAVLAVTLCGVQAVTAQQTVFRFLNLSPSPRMSALGGMHTAAPSPDEFSIAGNPALTAALPSGSAALSRTNLFADASLSAGVYAGRFRGTPFAASVLFLGYGDFQRIDGDGQVTGSTRAYDAAFQVAAAQNVTGSLSAGGAVSFVQSAYADVRASALLISAGAVYNDSTEQLRAAVSVSNAGWLLSGFGGEPLRVFRPYPGQQLPLDVRIGLSKKPRYVPVILHAGLHSLNRYPIRLPGEATDPSPLLFLSRHLTAGAELLLSDAFILRAGFHKLRHDQHRSDRQFDRAGLSTGLGLRVGRFTIDLSRSNFSDAGYVTQLAVRSRL